MPQESIWIAYMEWKWFHSADLVVAVAVNMHVYVRKTIRLPRISVLLVKVKV